MERHVKSVHLGRHNLQRRRKHNSDRFTKTSLSVWSQFTPILRSSLSHDLSYAIIPLTHGRSSSSPCGSHPLRLTHSHSSSSLHIGIFLYFKMPTTASPLCNSSSNDVGKVISSNLELRRRLPHATRIDKKYIVLKKKVMCHCFRPRVVKISWTHAHPRTRFYSCAHGHHRGGWDYFCWIEVKFTEYVSCILNDLVDTISNLLEERTNHVEVD
ncbi:hypothetical protein Syun_025356 [Stephania yunnanensis]|uniref:Uncharacterized protein n=1 Tax=Stephania yunnanensis TaxID=152371 RepID=A0AAP0HVQ6_9MAGN